MVNNEPTTDSLKVLMCPHCIVQFLKKNQSIYKSCTHFLFTHFIFFFLQQNNLDYVDPQIANLLFEAGQQHIMYLLT